MLILSQKSYFLGSTIRIHNRTDTTVRMLVGKVFSFRCRFTRYYSVGIGSGLYHVLHSYTKIIGTYWYLLSTNNLPTLMGTKHMIVSRFFFREAEFVYLFLCTVNVNNSIQFCRLVVSKYLWNHLMSRSLVHISVLC